MRRRLQRRRRRRRRQQITHHNQNKLIIISQSIQMSFLRSWLASQFSFSSSVIELVHIRATYLPRRGTTLFLHFPMAVLFIYLFTYFCPLGAPGKHISAIQQSQKYILYSFTEAKLVLYALRAGEEGEGGERRWKTPVPALLNRDRHIDPRHAPRGWLVRATFPSPRGGSSSSTCLAGFDWDRGLFTQTHGGQVWRVEQSMYGMLSLMIPTQTPDEDKWASTIYVHILIRLVAPHRLHVSSSVTVFWDTQAKTTRTVTSSTCITYV